MECLFFIHSTWNSHCYWWNNRWSNHSYCDRHCFMYQTKVGTSLIILYVFLFCVEWCVVFLFRLTWLCVPYVASFSRLSILDCHFAFLLPKCTLYCIYYLKKTSSNKIFCNKRFYVWVTISRAWPTEVNGSLYERWQMSLFRLSHSFFISV